MANRETFQKTKISAVSKRPLILMIVLTLMLFAACGKEQSAELKNSRTYYDVLKSLSEDKPVVIFLLDGLGFIQFEAARELGIADYIDRLGEVQKAETYYPSISPVGLAAMVTGVGPEKNGIKKRGDLELKVPDIFEETIGMGKTPVLIEGDTKLINTSIEPILNADLTGDGLTDEEVFDCALEYIGKDYDLIFVHFHGIDDIAHQFGPMSSEAMERTKIVTDYVEALCSDWEGAIIITSDHGQHDAENGGEHGTKMPEDMFVPYLYRQ